MKKLLLLILSSFLLFSCASLKEPKSVVEPIDYTNDDVVKAEVQRIKNFQAEEPVRALWRAFLLKQDEEILKECRNIVFEKYNKALEEKKYFEASSYLLSLQNSGMNIAASEKAKLDSLYASEIPGLSNQNAKAPKNINDCMNASVTIWVDRGVKIQNGLGYADIVLGSGFFIDKQGYLITNHHVIESMVNPKYEGFSRLYIKLLNDPDTKIPAKVIGYDSELDLALLKVEIVPEYVFSLGSSNELHIGDKVSAIGAPLGLEGTLTSGVISSTDRKLLTLANVFQIDAAVNSGNSGGPLIDQNMKVQAIVFAGMLQYQGLNFVIPVEYLRQLLPILYNGDKVEHSWIGAYGRTKRNGTDKTGLEVEYVMPGSSAALSGLKPGDVITHIGNKKINSLEDFHFTMLGYVPGTIISLTCQREDAEAPVTICAYLENRPENPSMDFYQSDLITGSFIPLFGMKLAYTNSSNHKEYSVIDVIKGSVADEMNFSENDKIIVRAVESDDEHKVMYSQIYAQRKKKGYLDAVMVLTTSFDSPYYF